MFANDGKKLLLSPASNLDHAEEKSNQNYEFHFDFLWCNRLLFLLFRSGVWLHFDLVEVLLELLNYVLIFLLILLGVLIFKLKF